MQIPKYMSVLGMLAAMSVGSDAANSGVCYSPWHHDSVTEEVVASDFGILKENFNKVRTFHASFSGVNVAGACSAAGLKCSIGIMMDDGGNVQDEIDAACDGVANHADGIEAIYVGNENLKNGDFGTYSADDLNGYIGQIKQCVSSAGASISVGSVQRINEWTDESVSASLAANCDTIGVNIYPFFSVGDGKPIDKFQSQFDMVQKMYGEKVVITETGWPTAGSDYQGNVPNVETTNEYLNSFNEFCTGGTEGFFFMAFDSTTAYGGGDYETHFGLYDTNSNLKEGISIPGGDGGANAPPASGNGEASGNADGEGEASGNDDGNYGAEGDYGNNDAPAASNGGDAPAPEDGDATPSPSDGGADVPAPEDDAGNNADAPPADAGSAPADATPATSDAPAADVPADATPATPDAPAADVPADATPATSDAPAADVPADATPATPDAPAADVPADATPDAPTPEDDAGDDGEATPATSDAPASTPAVTPAAGAHKDCEA